jgi:hypothetical protein
MIFGVEIAHITTRLDQLLKPELLRHEVGLQKQDMLAAAVSAARETTKPQALCK